MASLNSQSTIREYQDFIRQVYSQPNDLYFDLMDLFSNVERFAMRGLKGIRKNDRSRCENNLLIASSFFLSMLNRLHIDLEDELWKRFPFLCSYCGNCPCNCHATKPDQRRQVVINEALRPKNISQYQDMFEKIYPHSARTIDHSGVHMAEELGELAEVMMAYRGEHTNIHLENIRLEASDFFSCLMGVCNSFQINFAEKLAEHCQNNCHSCHQAPCQCQYSFVISYNS